jgi:hypothetical protein
MSQPTLAPQPVLAGVRIALDGLRSAAGGGAWQLTDDQLDASIDRLDRVEAALVAVRARLLREADQRGMHKRTKAPSTANWLADRFRWSVGLATSRQREAAALGVHPVLEDALAGAGRPGPSSEHDITGPDACPSGRPVPDGGDVAAGDVERPGWTVPGLAGATPGESAAGRRSGIGEVTVEQAGVLRAVLQAVEALERVTAESKAEAARFMVEQAASLSPRELSNAGRHLVESLTFAPSLDDPADAAALEREQERIERAAQANERNEAWSTPRPGSRRRGGYDLGPYGDAVARAWERIAGKKRAGGDGFEDDRTRAERLGDSLVDALAHHLISLGHQAPARQSPAAGAEVQSNGPGGANPNQPGWPDRHQEELWSWGDPLEEGAGNDLGPSEYAGPMSPIALLTITTSLDGLRRGVAGCGRLDTGAGLSAAALRQLACDALVVPAVMSGASQVLDLGRACRQWSLALRRAIALRDKGCAAPGCDMPPSACHVHHCRYWEHGGPTDAANGVLLCGYHHRMVHRQGWDVRLATNGFPEFIPQPSIDPERRPRQHHRYRLDLVTGCRRT